MKTKLCTGNENVDIRNVIRGVRMECRTFRFPHMSFILMEQLTERRCDTFVTSLLGCEVSG
jgi:hypothetical protein